MDVVLTTPVKAVFESTLFQLKEFLQKQLTRTARAKSYWFF